MVLPMAVSFQCMTKSTTILKITIKKLKKIKNKQTNKKKVAHKEGSVPKN